MKLYKLTTQDYFTRKGHHNACKWGPVCLILLLLLNGCAALDCHTDGDEEELIAWCGISTSI